MKRQLTTILLTIIAVTAMAIPAKRGFWKTITLVDGTQVRAELRGDKNFCCMVDEAGNRYVRNDSATYRLVTDDEVTAKQNKSRARRAAKRACYSSTTDGLGEYGKMSMGAVPSIGSYTIPVIMVQFSDQQFKSSTTVAKMNRYYNTEGYAEETGCVGSVRDYFKSQSHGMFVPTFDVVGIVTLDESYVTYGNDSDPYESIDDNIDQLPRDAVAAAVDQLGVDFSRYIVPAGDTNHKDGVPLVCILYAGKGQATESETTANSQLIWPCEWDCDEDMSGTHFNSWFVGNELYYDGELNGIGTFCHEFGHALGLPDFYCTNYNYENDDPFSDWSIMDTGSYVEDGYAPIGYTAYEKSYMGWLKLIELEGDGEKTLQSPADAGEGSAFIIKNSGTETFILENRQPGTWYPRSSHGSGLMLSRIAYSQTTWDNNTLNNTQNKKRAYIVTANGAKLDYSSSQANLYGNGVNNITSLKLYNGSSKTVSIKDITKNSDGTITFTYGNTSSGGGETSGSDVFEKVTSGSQIVIGNEYVLVCEEKEVGSGVFTDKYLASVDVTISESENTASGDGLSAFTLGGSSSGYSLKLADGNYLTTAAAKSLKTTGTESKVWTISSTSDGYVVKSLTDSYGTILYNASSPRFCNYTSNQKSAVLYVKSSTPTGIKGISITERPADNRIYSIDGRYVGNDLNILRPGIYIVGGRKVVR